MSVIRLNFPGRGFFVSLLVDVPPDTADDQRFAILKRVAAWAPLQRALNLGCLYLIFPLSLRISVPVGCAVAGSLWLHFGLRRRSIRGSQIAAWMLAGGALLWALFAPYVAFPGVTYCYTAHSNRPWSSAILPLHSASEDQGQLFYATDFVRASSAFRLVLRSLGLRVESIESVRNHVSPALVIPLPTAIRRTVLGTGKSVAAEELIISYAGSGLAVDLTRSSCPGKRCSVGVATRAVAANFVLVDYIRGVSDPSELPWSAVVYPAERERDAALYGAQLDFALQAFTQGDIERAVGALESAAPLAPTDLERSRLSALIGGVSTAILSGNIGQIQGLAFLNHAIKLWNPARSGKRLTRAELDNPVDRWLFDVFWATFLYHQAEYPVWRRVFAYSSMPVRTFVTQTLPNHALMYKQFDTIPSTPEASLVSAEKQRLREMVEGAGTSTGGVAEAMSDYITGRPELARWTFTVLVSDPAVAQTSITAPLRWREAVDCSAALCAEPWRSQYRTFLLLVQDLRALTVRLENEKQGVQTLAQQSRIFSQQGFPLIAHTFSAMAAESPATSIKQLAAEAAPPLPWWHRRYRDWFGTIAFTSQLSMDTCQVPGPKCRELLEQMARQCERDGGGKGNFFAPGVALAISWSQIVGQPIAGRWLDAFRDATGMQSAVWPQEQPLP